MTMLLSHYHLSKTINMLFIYGIFALYLTFDVEAYTNNLFYLIDDPWSIIGSCGGFTEVPRRQIYEKQKLMYGNTHATKKTKIFSNYSFSTVATAPKTRPDPIIDFQSTLNKVLFGEGVEMDTEHSPEINNTDRLGLYASGQIMRAEIFQNKKMVHLPRTEWLHPGHLYLNTSSPDFMQTAVNAFSIFLEGSMEDILRLPHLYVLRSARTIAMMKIAREKLGATWTVVKGKHRTEEISYRMLEYYRPLFKYMNGREMSKLNLDNEKILSFLGTHPELDRHQVGIIASAYIKRNPNWDTPRYLNLMNNILCGVPMKLIRRIPENSFLQLSHQVFYHIKACDALQRRFYLAMMTRTQVLGKSNSWGARDVARLGLLLSEVSGAELNAINPEAMAGITPQVMLEIPTRNLKFLTETQVRYLSQKALNILTKKLHAYDDFIRMQNSFPGIIALSNCLLYFAATIKLIA